jgi:hypothetical protein
MNCLADYLYLRHITVFTFVSAVVTFISTGFTFVYSVFTFVSNLISIVGTVFLFGTTAFDFFCTVFTFVSTVFTFVSTVFTFVSTVFTFVSITCLPSSGQHTGYVQLPTAVDGKVWHPDQMSQGNFYTPAIADEAVHHGTQKNCRLPWQMRKSVTGVKKLSLYICAACQTFPSTLSRVTGDDIFLTPMIDFLVCHSSLKISLWHLIRMSNFSINSFLMKNKTLLTTENNWYCWYINL